MIHPLLGAILGDANPILPSANELIWGSIAFIIVFLLLAKFAFPPAAKALQERTNKIQGDIDSAERDRDEARQMLADYRRQLAAAREESNRILDDARKTAEQLRRDLQTKAEEDASRMIDRAREDIAGERERAISDIRREVGSLAVDLASRVIGDSLDRERQLALVDRYIEDLAGSGNGNGSTGGEG
ncbi:MAG TPA: F0F1 ATP synthase subunit B [Actinomycetota bacterium]|nr:F0F1 ATP synthase subunit B [Actinomycetota bacterium]